jgi:hypothetical protein
MSVTVVHIGINRPTEINTLSQAWRKILKDKNINEEELKKRIQAFVIRPGQDSHDAAGAAANVAKELASDHMSWNAYVKGLTLIGIDEITMLV